MPKINVYVDDDLFKRINQYNLALSRICQDALWAAVEETEAASCASCVRPAVFYVQHDGGGAYVCRTHLSSELPGGVATVRSL